MSTSNTDNKWPAVIRSIFVAGMITGLCAAGRIPWEPALGALAILGGVPWLARLKK